MDSDSLLAISPVDGRYRIASGDLREIFSELGLMKYRVRTEVHWLKALVSHPEIAEVPSLSSEAYCFLDNLVDSFGLPEAVRVKEIESNTNHDVKAIEYFIKERIAGNPELSGVAEFIHFGCTSEDINNLSYGQMLRDGRDRILLPAVDQLIDFLRCMAHEHASIPLLSRTHGQPASPTTVGKELANFVWRLSRWRERLSDVELMGKMNGAVGNFNAHLATYPDIDWPELSRSFVTSLGLGWCRFTTQIEPHDYIAEFCHALSGFNTALLDLDRDMWFYLSRGAFKQKAKVGEVGSSTMPHKVNPIEFENSEGNIGVANAILSHLCSKLPVSRLQRDLSDSSALRNLGVAIAHSLIAFSGALRGLEKLVLNNEALTAELSEHWEVLAEPIQTTLRRYCVEEPYEQLKRLTQGRNITKDELHDFIRSLPIPEAVKQQLIVLTPHNYVGNAVEQAKQV